MSPEKIHDAVTNGAMKDQAAHLSDVQRVDVSEWLSGRALGKGVSGSAKVMSNACASNPVVRDIKTASAWNGWSPDPLANTRFQSAQSANLSAAAATRLRLKWAFGLPAAYSVYMQPTVVDGHLFIGSDSAYLYSLDAMTGCVHWSFQAQAALRGAPVIAPLTPGSTRMAVFFGDFRGNVYAVDASGGTLLWKVRGDAHPQSTITGAVKVYGGRVYVPVSSLEELRL
jgi:polyvinyl alcohol dehydrogenase (cytochrome)